MKLLLALLLSVRDEAFVEDFESPVFDGWERVSSDAHPPYNTFELVSNPAAARSGKQFLRMTTQGGSTALRHRAWTIDPARPYRVSVFARLNETRRNAAAVTLIWLNGDGERISETRSAPSSRPGAWQELSLEVARAPEGAASLSVRLDFDGDDVRGSCDFDRLVLAPFERLDVQPAGRAEALFTPEEYPRFNVSLAGAPAGSHPITCVMKSLDGKEDRRSTLLKTPDEAFATVDFRALKPGVYELTASVDGREARRTRTVLVPNPWISTGVRDTAVPPELQRAVVKGELRDAEGHPTSWWLAQRAMQDALEGAVSVEDPGMFPPGVRVAAFRKPDSAVLALWCETGEIELPLSLNEGAKVYPPLGAIRPLKTGETLRLAPLPVFIVGIDPLLLDLKLALGGAELPLQLNPSTRTLRLHNPYRNQTIRDVRVRLEALPAGWRVAPRSLSAASLAPDGELAGELQFSLPPSESEREQELRFEIGFLLDGREQVLHLSRLVRLSPAIRIEASVAQGPLPESKKLLVRVANASDRSMSLTLRARLPNLPEQIELLRDLAPGATSAPLEFVVKDAHLIDPTRLSAEIDVRESVGARAGARKVIPLR